MGGNISIKGKLLHQVESNLGTYFFPLAPVSSCFTGKLEKGVKNRETPAKIRSVGSSGCKIFTVVLFHWIAFTSTKVIMLHDIFPLTQGWYLGTFFGRLYVAEQADVKIISSFSNFDGVLEHLTRSSSAGRVCSFVRKLSMFKFPSFIFLRLMDLHLFCSFLFCRPLRALTNTSTVTHWWHRLPCEEHLIGSNSALPVQSAAQYFYAFTHWWNRPPGEWMTRSTSCAAATDLVVSLFD